MNDKYSIWLIPDNSALKYFHKLIKKIGKEYNSPIFLPHITILGNIKIVEKILIKKKSIFFIQGFKPIRLEIDRPVIGNNYFKSLYLKINKNDELLRLYHSVINFFKLKNSHFSPHLSLFYGYLDNKTKKEIIKSLNILKIKELLCDKIYIYKTEGEVSNWKLINKFSLK